MDQNQSSMSELTPVQLKFMEALLDGNTMTDACKIAGICRTTGGRWFRESEPFRQAYIDAKTAVFHTAVQGLIDIQKEVRETFRDLLSPTQPPGVRYQAAKHLDEMFVRLMNQDAGDVDAGWPPALLGA